MKGQRFAGTSKKAPNISLTPIVPQFPVTNVGLNHKSGVQGIGYWPYSDTCNSTGNLNHPNITAIWLVDVGKQF